RRSRARPARGHRRRRPRRCRRPAGAIRAGPINRGWGTGGGGRLAQILLGRELSQAAEGGRTPVLHLRLVGNVTRLLVVGFRAWKAEVAGEVSEDVRDRPEGNQNGVGSRQSAGEGQQILVRG